MACVGKYWIGMSWQLNSIGHWVASFSINGDKVLEADALNRVADE
jgi:hypothetical protein